MRGGLLCVCAYVCGARVTVRVHTYFLAHFPLSPLLGGLLCVRMRMCWLARYFSMAKYTSFAQSERHHHRLRMVEDYCVCAYVCVDVLRIAGICYVLQVFASVHVYFFGISPALACPIPPIPNHDNKYVLVPREKMVTQTLFCPYVNV